MVDHEIRLIENIQNSKGYNDILPEEVFSNFSLFIFWSAVLVMISVMFLVAPIFTKDKHRKLEYLQYTSKRGRRLYKDKVQGALLAALIIVTVELGVLFSLFLTRDNTIEMFYNSSVNSWMNNTMLWHDFTLREYMIFAVVLVYILSFGVALVSSYISRKSSRYITLIGVSMVVTLGLFKVMTIETVMWNGIGSIYRGRFLVEGFVLVLLFVGGGLMAFRYKKEKRISI
ncbi:MAG: hypothetical protein ACRC7N_12675 [Clostridium sp.]